MNHKYPPAGGFFQDSMPEDIVEGGLKINVRGIPVADTLQGPRYPWVSELIPVVDLL